MKTKKVLSVIIAVIFVLSLCSCGNNDQAKSSSTASVVQTELYISAASSLTESLNEIATLYKTVDPSITLTFNFAASGVLQEQIEQGANSDVFISAAQKQMTALSDKGLVDTTTKINLLENKVVLITPTANTANITSFEDSVQKSKTIAVGDPASVPVGQYTQEIFTYLKSWDQVTAKATLATNVKEVLTWVETGNVDCGYVYSTDAATSSKVKVICEAPAGSHKAVVYPAAGVTSSTHADAAKAFLEYLQTDSAQTVFHNFGFKTAS